VNDHLGVGVVGLEGVASCEELLAQRQVVVDLAVEDDLDAAVLVRHRLVRRRREVDDREPPEREPDLATGCDPQARPVGPAVHHRVAHPSERLAVDRMARLSRQPPHDPAHPARASWTILADQYPGSASGV
jgi:hypothetical protein